MVFVHSYVGSAEGKDSYKVVHPQIIVDGDYKTTHNILSLGALPCKKKS